MLPAESIQRLTAANCSLTAAFNLVPYKNNVSFNYSKYKLNRFYNEFINNFAVQQ